MTTEAVFAPGANWTFDMLELAETEKSSFDSTMLSSMMGMSMHI